MTHYRFRIQVGDQYTYRDGTFTLDRLVQDLLDEGLGYERDAELQLLLRKAKGEKVPEPPKPKPVRPEEIRITVEKVAPPQPPKMEKWQREISPIRRKRKS